MGEYELLLIEKCRYEHCVPSELIDINEQSLLSCLLFYAYGHSRNGFISRERLEAAG